jgi:hypothetical protein
MKQQINLYQPMFRRQKKVFSAVAMCQVAGIAVAGLLVVYGFGVWQLNRMQAEQTRVANQLAAAQQRLDSFAAAYPARIKSEALERELAALVLELNARQTIDRVLSTGAFGNTSGFSARLSALARQHVQGTWLTRVAIGNGGASVDLSGRALAPEFIPAYVQRLSNEAVFAGQGFHALAIERLPEAPRVVGFELKTAGEIADEGDG